MDGGEEEGKEGACFPDSYTQVGPWVCLRQAYVLVSLETDFLDIPICSVFISGGGVDSGKGWACCLAQRGGALMLCPALWGALPRLVLRPAVFSPFPSACWDCAVGRDLGGELA